MLNIIIKNYVVFNTTYTIVKKDNFYCAINNNYLDENGRLKLKLNGLQMHVNEDLERCLDLAKAQAEIDYYIDCGLSMQEAFSKVFKIDVNF